MSLPCFRPNYSGNIIKLFYFVALVLFHQAPSRHIVRANEAFSSGLLKWKNFRLDARVGFLKENSSWILEESFLTEFYSNQKRRARFNFREFQGYGSKQYFYDDSNRDSIIRISNGGRCDLVRGKDLVSDLFGVASKVHDLLKANQWLGETEYIPSYVIGLARLIIHVHNFRDRLKFDSLGTNPMNQRESIRYRLDDYFGATLYAHYFKTLEIWKSEQTPFMIEIELSSQYKLLIDYSLIQPIETSELLHASDQVDLFTFPLGSGCGQHIASVNLFTGMMEFPRVFSFQAVIMNFAYEIEPIRLFVAFDGFANAMRYESTIGGLNMEESHSVNIYDFSKNKKYNIRSKSSKSAKTCAISQIANQTQVITYSEPMIILPFANLGHMGSAFVRGIHTQVFEVKSRDLPLILFPHVYYTEANGNEQFKHKLPGKTSKEIANFTIVYHFSEVPEREDFSLRLHMKPIGNLVRVQVYESIHFLNSLIYNIDVINFVWQLSEAPNGKQTSDLFSVESECIGSGLYNRANMYMDLKFDISEQLNFIGPGRDLLRSTIKRNEGLRRALSTHSVLSATQVSKLQSWSVQSNEYNHIYNSVVSLSYPLNDYYIPIEIGTGILRSYDDSPIVTNFEECFWKAGNQRKESVHLLFTYCYSRCAIDLNPKVELIDGKPIYLESNLFILPDSFEKPCHLMRIEERSDSDWKAPNKEYWSTVFENLTNASLHLPVPLHGSEIYLKVTRLELFEDNWSSSSQKSIHSAQEGSDSHILTGLGLTLECGSRVDLKRHDRVKADDSKELDLDSPSISLRLCRAACMTEPNCGSFSLCASRHRQPTECMISELKFRDSFLLDQIKRAKQNTLKNGTLIEINTEGFPNMPHYIEVKADRRCQIYNRNVLGMFKRPTRVTHKSNASLIKVDDEEECAELCLERNIKHLRHNFDSNKREYDKWCTSFGYMESEISEHGKDTSAKHIKRGSCLLRLDGSNNESRDGKMLKYELIHSALYEKQYSYELKTSIPKAAESMQTQYYLSDDQIQALVDEGNNQKILPFKDAEICAKACFEQTISLKPWCRSFGFEQFRAMDGSDRLFSYCIFNSNTMSKAMKSHNRDELVKRVAENVTYCHYEPLFQLDLTSTSQLDIRYVSNEDQQGGKLSWVLKLIIIILSAATGLIIGSASGERVHSALRNWRDVAIRRSNSFVDNLIGNDNPNESTHRRFDNQDDDCNL